jgi:anthranilate synthase/aminodeoxychorismate synthase-like glutamine amidotransferase
MRVVMNDEISVGDIEKELKPSRILISPGPGTPDDAGTSLAVIEKFTGRVPIFGVCLGHQAIAQRFGGRVVRAPRPVHGMASTVTNDGRTIFRSLPTEFKAGRYHSLMVERETLPDVLEVSAETQDGIIMGIRHREFPIEGVQFHPESILTEHGKILLQNFLSL